MKTGQLRGKSLERGREPTIKFNPHLIMRSYPEMEPEQQWWETSAFTTLRGHFSSLFERSKQPKTTRKISVLRKHRQYLSLALPRNTSICCDACPLVRKVTSYDVS